jgi:nitronate monooxygenase
MKLPVRVSSQRSAPPAIFDIAAVIAGEAVGLIHDILPATEIVERIGTQAERILLGRSNAATAQQA